MLRARLNHGHQQPALRGMDRSPRLRTPHRSPARPPYSSRAHPGDERRQLPPQAEQAQTRPRQLLTSAEPRRTHPSPNAPRGVCRLSLRSRRHTPPQILQLPACLLAYFYSAALVEFYSALDILPSRSAASIMARPMRSLTLAAELSLSRLRTTRAVQPAVTWLSWTSGVLPMRSVMLAAMFMDGLSRGVNVGRGGGDGKR